MPSLAICPRCHAPLSPIPEGATTLLCETCGGSFHRGALSTEDPVDTPSISVGPVASVTALSTMLACPHCLTAMQPGDDPGTMNCPSCGGRWSDSDAQRLTDLAQQPNVGGTGETAIHVTPDTSPLLRKLLYGASLPERFVRSGVALTAGAVKELSGLLVPQAFQSSRSYQIAIHDSLEFLTGTIGGVGDPSAGADVAGDTVARKAIGNFVDLAGLATLHVSPMWLLAITSDIAYGGRTYLLEVAKALEEQGVIDETSTIHGVDDLLDAIGRSCGSAAGAFDKPPLSVEELRSVVQQTRKEIGSMDVTKVLPEAEVRRLWVEMQTVASQEGVGLLEVSSAMTMHTLDKVKTVSSGALTGIQVAGGLLNRNVLDHYRQALGRIKEQGFYAVLSESYRPYAKAVWNNFSSERKSWTETLLDPGNVTTAAGKLLSLLGRGPSDDS